MKSCFKDTIILFWSHVLKTSLHFFFLLISTFFLYYIFYVNEFISFSCFIFIFIAFPIFIKAMYYYFSIWMYLNKIFNIFLLKSFLESTILVKCNQIVFSSFRNKILLENSNMIFFLNSFSMKTLYTYVWCKSFQNILFIYFLIVAQNT